MEGGSGLDALRAWQQAGPGALQWLDLVALSLLGLAALRGLAIGLIREAFSLAALAAACLAVRAGTLPLAAWLEASAPFQVGALVARALAVVAIVVGVLGAAAVAGRLVRRGAQAAGLGLADRMAGGLLGAVEGALAIALLVAVGVTVLGRDHPALDGTRTLAAFEQVATLAAGTPERPPDVAAPPRP